MNEIRAAAELMVEMGRRQLREYEDEDHDDPELLAMLEGHLSVAEAYLAEHTPCDNDRDLKSGLWFRSACSGLWYRSRMATGSVDAVMVGGQIYDRRERKIRKAMGGGE